MKRVKSYLFGAAALLGGAGFPAAFAQTPSSQTLTAQAPTKPLPTLRQPSEIPTAPYQPLRYDEDWSFLRNPARRRDFFDPVKYIPLNTGGDSYLSLGGEARERYEYYRNVNFGKGPQDPNGYFLQRYSLHLDAHFGAGARLFTQLDSSHIKGRTGGPRPPDRDDLDWQQFFLDGKIALSRTNRLTLRFGRQEMVFGSGRLVNAGEGNNVRTRFDGARLWHQSPAWRIDAFVTRPTNIRPAAFDDNADHTRLFWGVYATGPLLFIPGGKMDLYYLDLDSRSETYVQGTASEIRRSVGTRLFGQQDAKKNGGDYNLEFIYQFGKFGPGKISAYGLDSDIGYTWRDVRFTPRIGLRANIASGDRDPKNPDLQTFNPLFPALNYYNLSADAGVRNIRDLHPLIDLHLARPVFLSAGWDFFWRDSLHDGLYNPARGVLLAGNGSTARYNGDQPEIQVRWTPDQHTTVLVDYTHASPGPFLKDNNAKALDYFTAYVTYKF